MIRNANANVERMCDATDAIILYMQSDEWRSRCFDFSFPATLVSSRIGITREGNEGQK